MWRSLLVLWFSLTILKAEKVLTLTDEEYDQLPALFGLDDYSRCLSQSRGVFCMGSFELSTDKPSPLYDVLKEFSKNTLQNFNHTKVHRGLCMTTTCRQHLVENYNDLKKAFEACVDQKIVLEYGLNAKPIHLDYCTKHGDKRVIDGIDKAFATLMLILLLLNVTGTLHHVMVQYYEFKSNHCLMMFSLAKNWSSLTNQDKSTDPRFDRFQCFRGMKVVSMFFVHMAHVGLGVYLGYVHNPRFLELGGHDPNMVLAYNGTVIVQTFFVIANFLLAYKMLVFLETKKTIDYGIFKKAVFDRFIRLSPSVLFMLGLSATLVPHLGDGPLWRTVVEAEAENCRANWLANLFYVHNYSGLEQKCMPQTWYLAADFQLYLVNILVLVWVVRHPKRGFFALLMLYVASVLLQFFMAYFWSLKPSLLQQTPESVRQVYKDNSSFHILYISGQGNMPGALTGLIFGFLHYNMEKLGVDIRKNKLFVIVYRLTVPAGFAWAYMGYFFLFTLESPLTIAIYATVDKPIFALIIGTFILGSVHKIDVLYRSTVEWAGWHVPSRLSLSALLLHTVFMRVLYGASQAPIQVSIFYIVTNWFAVSVSTYLAALPLTLMVEYPAINLYKLLIATKQNDDEKHDKITTEEDNANIATSKRNKVENNNSECYVDGIGKNELNNIYTLESVVKYKNK